MFHKLYLFIATLIGCCRKEKKYLRKKSMLAVAIILFGVLSTPLSIGFKSTSALPDPTTVLAVDPPVVDGIEGELLPGTEFSIKINVTQAPTTYAWEVVLSWDPALLNVSSVTEGDFLHRWEEDPFEPGVWYPKYATAFAYPPLDEANLMGEISVVCSLIGALPEEEWASGDGWLFSVRFKVKALGESVLDLSDTRLFDHLEVGSPASTYYPNLDGFFYNEPLPPPPYTNVSGRISTNTTWSRANSPYLVVDDVMVETDIFLTIEAGVEVRFASGKNLIIDGAFIAQGNSTHKITFTSNSATPKLGDWGTIRFRDSSIDNACIIDWAIIEYARAGVTLYRSSPKIDNSTFRFNTDGLYSESEGIARISNAVFHNNTSSGVSGSLSYTTRSEISDSLIQNNAYGVNSYGGSLTIQNSNISKNTYGVRANNVRIQETVISYNTYGVWVYGTSQILGSNISYNTDGITAGGYGTSVYISKSVISENNDKGISPEWYYGDYAYATFAISYSSITGNKGNGIISKGSSGTNTIHFSNLYNNTPYDVYNAAPYSGTYGDVNATNNWWGTTDTAQIDQKIYDYYDNFDLKKVFYRPILDSAVTIPPIAHDVAIVNVTASPTSVEKWGSVYINVNVVNQGDFDENVTVIAFYDSTQIGKWTYMYGLLPVGGSTTAYFYWYPSNVIPGNYTISAEVNAVPGETDIEDNVYVDGKVTVTGPPPIHDIAVTYISVSPTNVRPGELVSISVNVQNQGDFTESFTVTVYYDSTAIGSMDVTDLASWNSRTLAFSWNTSGVAGGYYQIKAVASIVSGETDTSDNTYYDGTVGVIGPQPPRAEFYYNPDRPAAGESVYFNAYSSYDPDGYIVSYAWDFGDGTTVTVTSPYWTHVFSSYGNFTVTLTVTDNTNQTGSMTRTIRVNAPPVAAFRWTPEEIRANETVTFESLSYDPDGWIVNYRWEFGDGTTAYGSVAEHVYTYMGTYWVSVYVTDNDGRGSSLGTQITVLPKLTMSITPDKGIVGTMVAITGANATRNDLVNIYWRGALIGTPTADSEREFSFSFVIPPSTLGMHSIRAVDMSTGNYNEQTFTVLPNMRITPISGPVGTKVTVNGTGFPFSYYMPGPAYLLFDDQFFAFAVADENGNMQASINIPLASPGPHTVKALITGYYPTYTLEEAFTVIDITPLDVTTDVGAIYFKGETAEFYVQTAFKGTTVNATSIIAKLNKPDGTTETSTPQRIATGLYKVRYTISGKGSMIGTYTLVVEAHYTTETVDSLGTIIKTFLVKPTWEREAPRIAAVSLASIGLISAMILVWRKEKKRYL